MRRPCRRTRRFPLHFMPLIHGSSPLSSIPRTNHAYIMHRSIVHIAREPCKSSATKLRTTVKRSAVSIYTPVASRGLKAAAPSAPLICAESAQCLRPPPTESKNSTQRRARKRKDAENRPWHVPLLHTRPGSRIGRCADCANSTLQHAAALRSPLPRPRRPRPWRVPCGRAHAGARPRARNSRRAIPGRIRPPARPR